jgi:hypothetical protein
MQSCDTTAVLHYPLQLVNRYGAYGDSVDPSFSSERLSLLDRGWVVAIAHGGWRPHCPYGATCYWIARGNWKERI